MRVEFHLGELDSMKKYPKNLFYKGNLELLKKKKISIIGTRRPSAYTKFQTSRISSELSRREVCVVSGAAMGVDSIAHQNAGADNTIAVMANGLDIRYPSVNKSIICDIEEHGLCLSQFEDGFRATPWSFVVRNEIVVSLGDVLVVTQADLKSGSMRSVEYALKMEKEIFVLPHRLGESEGTQYLLRNKQAKVIYDIEEFCSMFGKLPSIDNDGFLEFCKTNPSYDDAILKYGDKVFEYELDNKIEIYNGCVKVINH